MTNTVNVTNIWNNYGWLVDYALFSFKIMLVRLFCLTFILKNVGYLVLPYFHLKEYWLADYALLSFEIVLVKWFCLLNKFLKIWKTKNRISISYKSHLRMNRCGYGLKNITKIVKIIKYNAANRNSITFRPQFKF